MPAAVRLETTGRDFLAAEVDVVAACACSGAIVSALTASACPAERGRR